MNSKYLVLEIVSSSSINRSDIYETLRKCLEGLEVAIIYPTHDNKCYLGLKEGSMCELINQTNKTLLNSKQQFTVKLIDDKRDLIKNEFVI